MRAILKSNFLMEIDDQTHIYLFPQSVKRVHPEFDEAIEVILSADPRALVLLAVVRHGRDLLPNTHMSVRHDLMHPAMPIAGA